MASRGDEATGGTRGGTPEKAGSGRAKASNDAVLRALEEVERTLERLKQARAERAEAEARYKAELERRDTQLADVEQRAAELERERAEALARAGELEARCGEIEGQLRAEFEQVSARCAEAEAHLDEATERSDRLERRLGEVEAELDTERVTREVVESKLQEAEALRGQLEDASRRLTDLEGDLGARSGEAEALRQEAEAAAMRIGALEAELAQAREGESALTERFSAELEALRAESDAEKARLRAEIERIGGESSGRAADLERRLAELDARAGEADEARRSKESELAEVLSSLAIFEAKAEEQRAELERMHSELEAARAEAREASERLADSSGETDARIAELRGQIEEAERREAALRLDCEAAMEAAAEAEAAGTRVAGAFEERIAALEQELASAQRLASDLEAGSQAGAELAERVMTLEAELEASRSEAREMAEKLDAAADRLVALQQSLDERERALQSLNEGDGATGELLAELSVVRAEAAELRRDRDALAKRKSRGEPQAGREEQFMALRRRRLAFARRLIRERTRAVVAHQATLERRLGQCDEVLARRRELVEARQIVEQTHQKVISGRAKASAAAMVFFGAGLLSVLGVVSWAIVGQMYPATYAAAAVVSADFHGATPGPGDRENWQTFHQQLLLDPQLMSRVAERMAQRGFTELSSPAEVKARLSRDLTWSCPEAGKLALELRGVGGEATARALDTYATTLANEANALRQRRADTATTVVSEPARPGSEPIVDNRPRQAAVGLAGGASVSLLLWFGIWRRMVTTKRAFENASQIDHLLEEGRWVDPIQQIIEAHNEGARAA